MRSERLKWSALHTVYRIFSKPGVTRMPCVMRVIYNRQLAGLRETVSVLLYQETRRQHASSFGPRSRRGRPSCVDGDI